MDLVQAQLPGHGLPHFLGVPGEHHRLFDASGAEGGDGTAGLRLHLVRDDDMPGVASLHRQMDDGAGPFAVLPGNAPFRHQLLVAGQDGFSIHHRLNPPAGKLLHRPQAGGVQLLPPCLPQGMGDGMLRVAFRQGAKLQELRLLHPLGMDSGDLKHPLGEGAGLIKDHHLGIRQGLQVAAALYQHANLGFPANPPEKAEGHGDHQGAGTGDHQEDKGPMDPLLPAYRGKERRQNRQQHCRHHHHRGVVPGEPGDEVFHLGLFGAGVFHQVQDAGHCGFPIDLGGPHPQQPALVDAATDYRVAGGDGAGQTLPGEGGGIQGGVPFQHHPVQRDTLPGFDDDGIPHRHLLRIHLAEKSVLLDVGVIRTNVHQGGDGAAGTAHRHALKQLSGLVKEHHCHRLRVFPGEKGPHGG